jgi:hypothetical protein
MKIEITTEQLRPYSIMVGTPMYGGNATGMYTKATNDLSMLCTAAGIKLKYYFLFNESLVQRARNYVVDEFLRSDFTHLMFIDSDISFDARDVLGMLGIQTQNPEKYDIMTAPYPKKTIAWEKVAKAAAAGKADENPFNLEQYTSDFVFNPVKGTASFELGEPLEIREGGTGFMLIPREVFEKYKKAYPELAYRPDHARTENFDGTRDIHAYFDCVIDPESKRYLSEDYFFCRKAREAGMSVWMCPWMKLNHVGSYVFRGDMGAIGTLGVSATSDASAKKSTYTNKSKNVLTKQKKRNRMNK